MEASRRFYGHGMLQMVSSRTGVLLLERCWLSLSFDINIAWYWKTILMYVTTENFDIASRYPIACQTIHAPNKPRELIQLIITKSEFYCSTEICELFAS
ncbi:hypothetical protein EYC80_000515 [Monilinia laxa]|uniref:Uncharacterized protein n=1 Tax=Monilinia laxa TaxID=61186 RepID=A0A5N6KAW0_MONLA|nr:hypothetical protein EYC80_000515 [Monilinia laxa]